MHICDGTQQWSRLEFCSTIRVPVSDQSDSPFYVASAKVITLLASPIAYHIGLVKMDDDKLVELALHQFELEGWLQVL